MYVVYFDQLSGAVRTQKLVELLFFSRFQPFLFILNWKRFEMNKKGWKRLKKAFGCAQHPKAGQNTQQMYTKWNRVEDVTCLICVSASWLWASIKICCFSEKLQMSDLIATMSLFIKKISNWMNSFKSSPKTRLFHSINNFKSTLTNADI